MAKLKQSTTKTIQVGPFLDKTDGVTAESGLAGSMTVYLSKDGAAFAARNSATAISYDRDGWYRVELDADDTDTLGRLLVMVHDAATHCQAWHEFEVQTANKFDSERGTDKLQVDVQEWIGAAPNALVSGRVDSSTGAMATGVVTAAAIATDALGALELAADAVAEIAAAMPSSAAIADAVWDEARSGHVGAGSFGETVGRVKTASHKGTAQAGGASTITLDTGASTVDAFYRGDEIKIVAGTGAGQSRIVGSYVGATRVATMTLPWATVPDNTSQFEVFGSGLALLDASVSSRATPAQVATELANIHLDHLLAADTGGSLPGAAGSILHDLLEDDGGTWRYKANALEQAPAGGGGGASADAVADAVWDKHATMRQEVDWATGDITTFDPDGVTPRGTRRITEVDATTEALVPQ